MIANVEQPRKLPSQAPHPDVVPTLDIPGEDDTNGTFLVCDAVDTDIGDGLYLNSKHDAPTGIQQRLLWAVQARLRLELTPPNRKGKNAKMIDQWLVRRLRANNWWIRRKDAPKIAENLDELHNLGLGKHHAGYLSLNLFTTATERPRPATPSPTNADPIETNSGTPTSLSILLRLRHAVASMLQRSSRSQTTLLSIISKSFFYCETTMWPRTAPIMMSTR